MDHLLKKFLIKRSSERTSKKKMKLMKSLIKTKTNKIALVKNLRRNRKKSKNQMIVIQKYIPMKKKMMIKYNLMDRLLKMLFKLMLIIVGRKIDSMICLEIWMKMKRGDFSSNLTVNLVILIKIWKINRDYWIKG